MIHATCLDARLRSWLVSSKSDRGGPLEDSYCSSTGKHEFLGDLLINSRGTNCKTVILYSGIMLCTLQNSFNSSSHLILTITLQDRWVG